MNKASGGDGITAELFQTLKDDAVKVLHSICQQIWKTQQWPQDWKRSVFISIPNKGSAKECSNYRTITFNSKEMPKLFQTRPQQHVNHELPDVPSGFSKCRGTRDQIASFHWIIEKAREFQKKSTSALLTMPKPLTMWITKNSEKFFMRWEYQTPYLPPEKPVYRSRSNRNRHGTIDCFQIGKEVCQGCILSPCLFNLYAEYMTQNAGLDESQAEIKIARRIIDNFGYVDASTVMEEHEDELKRLLMCWGPASAGSTGYPQDERHRGGKTRETSLDGAKSSRERERVTRSGVQQSLANLYLFYCSFYILS